MKDLEIAKNQLRKKKLTLAIVRNGRTLFETQSHRISGFLTAIEHLGTELEGASVADKVAGKAVALLFVYTGINAVYAETMSSEAKNIFEKNRVTHEWKKLVASILDENKSDVCPFEKEAENVATPKDAYDKFKALQKKLSACR